MTNTTTAIETIETIADTRDGMIAHRNGHKRFVPAESIRVTSMWGQGQLVSVTADGWAEVRMDGESRLDEYPAEHVFLA